MGGTFSDTHYYPPFLTSNPKSASPYPPGDRLVPLPSRLSLRPHTYAPALSCPFVPSPHPPALSPVPLPIHLCSCPLTCVYIFLPVPPTFSSIPMPAPPCSCSLICIPSFHLCSVLFPHPQSVAFLQVSGRLKLIYFPNQKVRSLR